MLSCFKLFRRTLECRWRILPSPGVLLVPAGIRAGFGCDAVDQRQGDRRVQKGSCLEISCLKGESGLHEALLGVHCQQRLLSHLCRVLYTAYLRASEDMALFGLLRKQFPGLACPGSEGNEDAIR